MPTQEQSGKTPLDEFLALPPEERRIGPFRLVQRLGSGTFAPVWLAEEVYGSTRFRAAAVKLFSLDPRPGVRGAKRDRIISEARALEAVEHPNVVRFYALVPDDARGLMGLAMEYVDGLPLSAKLPQGGAAGPLPIAEVIALGIDMASALAAAHQAGLVHRDVKPANVVWSNGSYKLIDFGIAAARGDETRGGTSLPPPTSQEIGEAVDFDDWNLDVREGGAVAAAPPAAEVEVVLRDEDRDLDIGPIVPGVSGTKGYIDPHYMALSGTATFSSDIYSLGAMLFECLTGHVPAQMALPTERRSEGFSHHVLYGRESAPPVLVLAPETPPDLARLVDAMLSPRPSDRPRSAESVARALEQIRGELRGRERRLPPEGPFRGLERFELADRDVFFGRGGDVAAAIEVLRSSGMVALVGPSGSGKSSLARAGVLPAVLDGALGRWPEAWDHAIVSPGADPEAALIGALAEFAPGAADRGHDAIALALAERAFTTGRGLVLVVDQLEELVTLAAPDLASRAAALLARLARHAAPGVRVIAALRRDFLDPLIARSRELGRAVGRTMSPVGPMDDAAWTRAVDRALDAYGYAFEDEALRERVIEELTGKAAAMPLVEFALGELWARRDEAGARITWAGFNAVGGLHGALEQYADGVLAGVQAKLPKGSQAARHVLTALTTELGTRAFKPRDELSHLADLDVVLPAFEAARIVVRDGDRYTLAHDTLLADWGTLGTWVAADESARRRAGELEYDAKRWSRSGDPTLLWERERLAEAAALRRSDVVRLTDVARRFVGEALRVEQSRVAWNRGIAAGVVLVSILIGAYVIRSEKERRLNAEFIATAAVREKDQAEQIAMRAAEAAAEREKRQKERADAEKERADAARTLAALQEQAAKDSQALIEQAKKTFACKAAFDMAKRPGGTGDVRPPGIH